MAAAAIEQDKQRELCLKAQKQWCRPIKKRASKLARCHRWFN